MDRFGREQLIELIEQPEAPSVSIYLPIERQTMTKKANRLQFRSALERAEALLKGSNQYEPQQLSTMLDNLRELVDENTFWNYMPQGLAVFAAPNFQRIYRLPVSFDEEVVVGDNFHTRPMMKYLLAPDRYWVLAVGQKEIGFWEGSRAGLTEIDLRDTLEENIYDDLFIEVSKDQQPPIFHSSEGHGQGKEVHFVGETTRGLPAAYVDAGGSLDKRQLAYIKEHFRNITRVVDDLIKGEPGPLIFAGVDYLHPIFHEACDIPNLLDVGLEGNVHYWSDAHLHEKAWPLVEKTIDYRVEETLALWERSFGAGKGEMDPATIARRILESRVRTLLIEEGRNIWGHFDAETGDLRIVSEGRDDPSADVVDILDDLAEQTILLGGNAMFVPADKMPGNTGVAAILRG